eukprot:1396593-Rhodomonas_salina.2
MPSLAFDFAVLFPTVHALSAHTFRFSLRSSYKHSTEVTWKESGSSKTLIVHSRSPTQGAVKIRERLLNNE